MMLKASSMAPLHLLGQNDRNAMQMTSGYVTPLALVSVPCDANDIINGTTAFVRLRQWKWGTLWLFWSCDHWHHSWHYVMLTALSMTPLHLLLQDNQNDVPHDFLAMWHNSHGHHVLVTASPMSTLYPLG